MLGVHELQDLMMCGQFEGFGHRKIWMQRAVEDGLDAGAIRC